MVYEGGGVIISYLIVVWCGTVWYGMVWYGQARQTDRQGFFRKIQVQEKNSGDSDAYFAKYRC